MYDDEGNYVGPALGPPKERSRKRKARELDAGADESCTRGAAVDPFAVPQKPSLVSLSPFFSVGEGEPACAAETFGEREPDTIPRVWQKDDQEPWVNPKVDLSLPKETNVVGACSYRFDGDVEAGNAPADPLAPVALAAAQRVAEKKKEERQVQRNRAQLQREKVSYNAREKRKRDIGQASSDKNFVEEEKRILRQQFEGF
eukprot:RCo009827